MLKKIPQDSIHNKPRIRSKIKNKIQRDQDQPKRSPDDEDTHERRLGADDTAHEPSRGPQAGTGWWWHGPGLAVH